MIPAICTKDYRVVPGAAVDLTNLPTLPAIAELGDRTLRKVLKDRVKRFSTWQELLYAEDRRALLLVFQGMDASGKDSAIKQVTSGVNPQGFRVTNFNRPSSQEIEYSWLHRHWLTLPERGRIGIFNRSHYEEVVTVRVHPDYLRARKLPARPVDQSFWDERLDDIVAFEGHLVRNGTSVLKFFLNVSPEEQKRRLTDRLRNPKKHWKFDPSDLEARQHWDAYRRAYEEAFQATSTATAPWFVIPADSKPAARVIIGTIIVETLAAMAPAFPDADDALVKDIQTLRRALRP